MWTKISRGFAEKVVYQAVRIATLSALRDGRNTIDWIDSVVFDAICDTFDEQEIPRRVGAEMLGMSRRGFIKKVNNRSLQDRDGLFLEIRSVLSSPSSIEQILLACSHRDEQTVRSMVHNLVQSGVLIEGDGKYSFSTNTERNIDEMKELAMIYRWWPRFGIGEEEFVEMFDFDEVTLRTIWADAATTGRLTAESESTWALMDNLFENTSRLAIGWLSGDTSGRNAAFFQSVKFRDVLVHREVWSKATDIIRREGETFDMPSGGEDTACISVILTCAPASS